jgi:hypothetical protein
MTVQPTAWRVFETPPPWRVVTDQDLLATIVAPDREQARQTAARIFPWKSTLVIAARAWPLQGESDIRPAEPGGESLHRRSAQNVDNRAKPDCGEGCP